MTHGSQPTWSAAPASQTPCVHAHTPQSESHVAHVSLGSHVPSPHTAPLPEEEALLADDEDEVEDDEDDEDEDDEDVEPDDDELVISPLDELDELEEDDVSVVVVSVTVVDVVDEVVAAPPPAPPAPPWPTSPPPSAQPDASAAEIARADRATRMRTMHLRTGETEEERSSAHARRPRHPPASRRTGIIVNARVRARGVPEGEPFAASGAACYAPLGLHPARREWPKIRRTCP